MRVNLYAIIAGYELKCLASSVPAKIHVFYLEFLRNECFMNSQSVFTYILISLKKIYTTRFFFKALMARQM